MFWDHLTLLNIGNSLFDLQISTLGTRIRPRNLPLRPGVPQLTFGSWILSSGSRILDSGSWIFDSGLWIVNSQLWIVNSQLWIVNYDWWLWLMMMIDDYDLWLWFMIMISQHPWLCFPAKPPAGRFSEKNTFFEFFYRKRKLQKLSFFVKTRTLNPRFSRKLAPAFAPGG